MRVSWFDSAPSLTFLDPLVLCIIYLYIYMSSAPAGRSMLCCAAVNGFEVLAPEILSSTRATVFRVLYGCLLKSVCLRVRVWMHACVCVCVRARACGECERQRETAVLQ